MDVYPTSPQGGKSANIDYVCVDVCIWYENSGLDHRITWRPLIFCYRTKDIYTLLWARPWSLYRFNKFGMGKCSWACFVSSQGKEETGYCVFYFYVCPHLENGGGGGSTIIQNLILFHFNIGWNKVYSHDIIVHLKQNTISSQQAKRLMWHLFHMI